MMLLMHHDKSKASLTSVDVAKGQNFDHTLKTDTRSRSISKTLTMDLRSIEHCCLFLQHIFGHCRYQ